MTPIMDNHAKDVLKFIARVPEGRSYYEIIRSFGFPDAPYDINEILRLFVRENFAELNQPEAGVNAKYLIKPNGIQILKNDENINSKVDHEAILQKVHEEDTLIQAVMDGNERKCLVCGSLLKFVPPNAGIHPGIYCVNGCTKILLSMRLK